MRIFTYSYEFGNVREKIPWSGYCKWIPVQQKRWTVSWTEGRYVRQINYTMRPNEWMGEV